MHVFRNCPLAANVWDWTKITSPSDCFSNPLPCVWIETAIIKCVGARLLSFLCGSVEYLVKL